ncbi:hypothetical protein BC828DRAFT_375069 [Blastocladiella britannica]|nr:hypothetical protein BC828DRAFT_375069 [Blastocladiella britannica]
MQKQQQQHAPGAPERDILRLHRAGELVERKSDLIAVDAHASVWTALAMMETNRVQCLPVKGAAGHWVTSASMQQQPNQPEADLIAIISLADIGRWLANFTAPPWRSAAELVAFLHRTQVIEVVGQTPESRTLWTIPAASSIIAALEPLATGSHRVLVAWDPATAVLETTPVSPTLPVSSPTSTRSSSSGPTSLRLCSQTDAVRLIHALRPTFPAINAALQQSLVSLGLLTDPRIAAIAPREPAVTAVRSLADAAGAYQAMAVVDPATGALAAQWSWTDVRDPDALVRALTDPAVVVQQLTSAGGGRDDDQMVVVPAAEGSHAVSLDDVLERLVFAHAHRAWIVDSVSGAVVGIITLTDVLRVVLQVAAEDNE